MRDDINTSIELGTFELVYFGVHDHILVAVMSKMKVEVVFLGSSEVVFLGSSECYPFEFKLCMSMIVKM